MGSSCRTLFFPALLLFARFCRLFWLVLLCPLLQVEAAVLGPGLPSGPPLSLGGSCLPSCFSGPEPGPKEFGSSPLV